MKQINPNLTEDQKRVLFDRGTEAPFTGKFLSNEKTGDYTCANCGNVLFGSDTQYESKTPGLAGWPSFSDVASTGSVKLTVDDSFGMHRMEATCANCGAHLGHLFEGLADHPSGVHYCINSCSLDFKEKK